MNTNYVVSNPFKSMSHLILGARTVLRECCTCFTSMGGERESLRGLVNGWGELDTAAISVDGWNRSGHDG